MNRSRCSVSFKRRPIGTLGNFASGVREGMYVTNPGSFPLPPLTSNQLTTLINNYTQAWANYLNARGEATRGAFDASTTALIDGLLQLVDYVDVQAAGVEAVVRQSGFEPIKASASSKPKPDVISGMVLQLGAPQSLTTDCDPQPQIDTYVAVLTEGTPLPPDVTIVNEGQLIFATGGMLPRTILISCSKSRKKTFTGLNAGTIYYLTMFGIGTGGVGDLCTTVKRMCN